MIFFHNSILHLINTLIIVPQIFKNFKMKYKNFSNNLHLIVLIVLNNIIPIYTNLYENNILRIAPNKHIGYLIITILCV